MKPTHYEIMPLRKFSPVTILATYRGTQQQQQQPSILPLIQFQFRIVAFGTTTIETNVTIFHNSNICECAEALIRN